MSNSKNPNAFDDLDAEATVMSPNAAQDLLNMIPPPPVSYQQQARHTPPPITTPIYHQPAQAPVVNVGINNTLPYPPSSAPPTSIDPFVAQAPGARVSLQEDTTESSETKLLTNPGDISSEQTVVHGTMAGPLVPLAKLVILEGLQKNKEYPLLGTEISFGREKDNIITYPDLSVSRHHFKIHCNKDKFSLEDLGGGNGTWINNKKIKGTVPLSHTDQIRVGKSLIQFVLIGKDTKSTPRSNSSTTLVFAVLVGFLLLGGGAFGVYWFNQQRKPEPQPISTAEQATMELRRGLNLRQREKWLEAKLAFEQALQMDPNNLQAQQLLEDTKAEINTIHQLQRVQFLVAQDNKESYKSAKTILTRLGENLPPGSNSAPKAWALLSTVNQKLKQLEPQTSQPDPRVDPPQPPRVREEAWGFETARQCRRNCRGRGKQCKRFSRNVSGRRQRRWICVTKGTVTPPPQPSVTPRPVQTVSIPQPSHESRADKLYRGGNLQGAADAYGKANESEKQQLVLSFAKAYFHSLSAYKSYDPKTAIPALQEALKLDLLIGEGKSVYTQQIRQMLANMYFSKGLLLMGHQSYTLAYEQFVLAMRQRPGHKHALQKINELRSRAQQWLEQAKGMMKSNPAQAKMFLQKIQRITSRRDAIHREASNLLSQN